MPGLWEVLESARAQGTQLECYDRHGECVRRLDVAQLLEAVRCYRTAFSGWRTPGYCGHNVVGLFFRPEETVEFLVATFAAIAEGFTVVPFYPNWSAEAQRRYLREYDVRAVATGAGFHGRVQRWRDTLERVVRIDLAELPPALGKGRSALPDPLSPEHPCAWIFTSGTSGEVPKCTVITHRNLEAAIENIARVDFLRPGMALHSPLSTSHIFAFTVVLGMLATRARRIIFSDVQYLARLPEERIGRIDGVILVPIVLNRLRRAFYEKLLDDANGRDDAATPAAGDAGGGATGRGTRTRRLLKRCVRRAEDAVLQLEQGDLLRGARGGLSLLVTRLLFGRRLRRRLGSPRFVVVGGAKPDLHAMAFLEALGIRCLQGWGMTETTGPLAVCRLHDRFRGAFGTCGELFADTRARVEAGELVVESPQVAAGYLLPGGVFEPFDGRARTGDAAEFDERGRLRVIGKVSDRITLTNGLNYNPLIIEARIAERDLERGNLLEEAVVVGDGQPRLGCVFFLRDPAAAGGSTRRYLEALIRDVNSTAAVDERIGPWAIHAEPLRESPYLGPSGKIRRAAVERAYQTLYRETALHPTA